MCALCGYNIGIETNEYSNHGRRLVRREAEACGRFGAQTENGKTCCRYLGGVLGGMLCSSGWRNLGVTERPERDLADALASFAEGTNQRSGGRCSRRRPRSTASAHVPFCHMASFLPSSDSATLSFLPVSGPPTPGASGWVTLGVSPGSVARDTANKLPLPGLLSLPGKNTITSGDGILGVDLLASGVRADGFGQVLTK